jgi:RNA-binding protein
VAFSPHARPNQSPQEVPHALNPLRRRLRGLGHALDPVVQIGKLGATSSVFKQVGQALLDHELIKVKLGSECPETRFELAERFGAEPA